MIFWVVDKRTGREADPEDIALHEDWAHDLIWCDMEGFALLQNGALILVDECGNWEFCPKDRFVVVKYISEGDEELPSSEPERTAKVKDLERRSETSMCWEGICTNCGSYTIHEMNYCFHCGSRLEWE